jgi:YbbR domain-containing protein
MKQNRFLQWVVFEWPAKVISLLAAVLLFFFVQMIMVDQRSFMVPLHVETQEAFYVSSTYPDMVNVTITGGEDDIFMIYPDDLYVVLDASQVVTEGLITIPLTLRTGDIVRSMNDVQIELDPAEVRIQLTNKE